MTELESKITVENLVIKKFVGRHDLRMAAEIAIENRLYVRGWTLKKSLTSLIFYASKGRILRGIEIHMAYMNNIPVGIIFARIGLPKYKKHFVSVFVLPAFRRCGIGKLLIKNAVVLPDYTISYTEGIKGSITFFRKCQKTLTEEQSERGTYAAE